VKSGFLASGVICVVWSVYQMPEPTQFLFCTEPSAAKAIANVYFLLWYALDSMEYGQNFTMA
jgi:hypothetical protein